MNLVSVEKLPSKYFNVETKSMIFALFKQMKSKFFLLLFLIVILALPSCSLFKKKCDCPDHRRSKRIALEVPVKEDIRI